jgi:hypothetical protein
METERAKRLANFVSWVGANIKGDEKGEAQVFLDRFFQAFGHAGLKEAGATLEERIKKGPGKGTLFADLVWKLNEPGPGPPTGMFRPAAGDCVFCLNRRTPRSEKALWVAKRHEPSA